MRKLKYFMLAVREGILDCLCITLLYIPLISDWVDRKIRKEDADRLIELDEHEMVLHNEVE